MINHLIESIEIIGNNEILSLSKEDIEGDKQYENKILKYQWDSYQTVLMILRNNKNLNHVHLEIVKKCIIFCKKLNRTLEFKKSRMF